MTEQNVIKMRTDRRQVPPKNVSIYLNINFKEIFILDMIKLFSDDSKNIVFLIF